MHVCAQRLHNETTFAQPSHSLRTVTAHNQDDLITESERGLLSHDGDEALGSVPDISERMGEDDSDGPGTVGGAVGQG